MKWSRVQHGLLTLIVLLGFSCHNSGEAANFFSSGNFDEAYAYQEESKTLKFVQDQPFPNPKNGKAWKIAVVSSGENQHYVQIFESILSTFVALKWIPTIPIQAEGLRSLQELRQLLIHSWQYQEI